MELLYHEVEDFLLRFEHVSVTWKNNIIVWGGDNGEGYRFDPSKVYVLTSEKWHCWLTTGDVPDLRYTTASVVGDEMLVFGKPNEIIPARISIDDIENIEVPEVKIYALDLNTWNWSRKDPSGIKPSKTSASCTSWVYKDKIKVPTHYIHIGTGLTSRIL